MPWRATKIFVGLEMARDCYEFARDLCADLLHPATRQRQILPLDAALDGMSHGCARVLTCAVVAYSIAPRALHAQSQYINCAYVYVVDDSNCQCLLVSTTYSVYRLLGR